MAKKPPPKEVYEAAKRAARNKYAKAAAAANFAFQNELDAARATYRAAKVGQQPSGRHGKVKDHHG